MFAIGRRSSEPHRAPRAALALSVCALLSPEISSAVQFENAPAAQVSYDGDVPVVTWGDATYFINEVPSSAESVETFTTLPAKYQSKSTLALDVGSEIAADDVKAVLDAWYRETAIDYDSIRIRSLAIGDRQFVSYCLDSTIFGCIDGKILAGTVVTYEVNGANRSGGMTGFQARTVVIRKQQKAP